MNGPQHYREAERLLAEAADVDGNPDINHYCLTAAQVHATLALAAEGPAAKEINRSERLRRAVPHGPDEPCTCNGCSSCSGHAYGCTCDIDWDELVEIRLDEGGRS